MSGAAAGRLWNFEAGRRYMSFGTIASALSTACIGCVDAAPAGRVVSDSGGVTIVQSAAGAPVRILRADTTPVLTIGGATAEGAEVVHNVRWGALLEDGAVVVLDGNDEVRLFDAAGRHLRSFGGPGDGPGELRQPQRVWALADSLVVWQADNRLTVYPLDGSPPRVLTSSASRTPTTDRRAWLDGARVVLALSNRPPIIEGMAGEHPGDVHVQVDFTAVALDDGESSTVVSLPGAVERYLELRIGRFGQMNFYPLAMYGAAHGAGSPGRFYAGSARRPEVQVFDTTGSLVRVVRWDTATTAIGDEMAERFRASQVPAMRAVPLADSVPYFDELAADTEGRLWVRLFDARSAEVPQRWMIFDRDGRRSAVAYVPHDMEVLDVGLHHLLALGVDSRGAQALHVLRLVEERR
ncbi:MAG: hypothetical protein WEB88_08905 [Gemmatimonadota bacterium]